MTDYCIFPVANLKTTGLQECNQKCTYVGNYNTLSTGNTLVQEAPYTMCNIQYNGTADVMFNGVSYSNSLSTNTIEISLTKPLHTFDSSLNSVGELLIRHSSLGYNDLWVCIPIVNVANAKYNPSSNLKSSSIELVETIINNTPGPPYVKYTGSNTLLRQGSNPPLTLPNSNKISNHKHTLTNGSEKAHSHYHIPNLHDISEGTLAYSRDKEIASQLSEGGSEISNQVSLDGFSFMLNNVIPTAPYYYYRGLYSTDCSTTPSYGSTSSSVLNVIVFDIANAIPISESLANALSITKVTNSKIPILLDNCYTAQEDTDNNVNYHSGSFTTNVSSEDDIYIDCQPTDACGNTVLVDEKDNNVIDTGDSADVGIGAIMNKLIDSPIIPMLVGIIAIFIVYKLGRMLLRVIFGKENMPLPAHLTDSISHMDPTKL